MSYNIEVTGYFSRQLKRLIKKYPSLKKEMLQLIESLELHPQEGAPLGKDCFKIRLAISSKGKGKSSGARVITHVYIFRKIVYLLAVYDKSEQANIPSSVIDTLIQQLRMK